MSNGVVEEVAAAATDGEPEGPSAAPPTYNFNAPTQLTAVAGQSIALQHHVRRTGPGLSAPSVQSRQYFWRRVVWSPDGTHLLAQSDDHHIDIFVYQADVVKDGGSGSASTESSAGPGLTHVFSLRAPSTLLAAEWYPFAQYGVPATWCFVFSARDVPTRLVDAYSGQTRATYGILDHTERFVGPQALAFNLLGTQLYCAHDARITTFELTQPGINTYIASMALRPSRRLAKAAGAGTGQRGAVSCLAPAPDYVTGSGHELLAVGTFAGTIGIYRMDGASGNDGSVDDSVAEACCIAGWKEAAEAGVAQLAFHPAGPHILFVTSRRSTEIRAYDLQYVGSRRSFLHTAPDVALLGIFERDSDDNVARDSRRRCSGSRTQQRLLFALDWAGRFLISGSAAGHVRAWDVMLPGSKADNVKEHQAAGQSVSETSTLNPMHSSDDFFGRVRRHQNDDAHRAPMYSWPVAADAVPSVALHPHLPLLACASGARHWDDCDDGSDGSSSGSDTASRTAAKEPFMHARDATLRLLQLA